MGNSACFYAGRNIRRILQMLRFWARWTAPQKLPKLQEDRFMTPQGSADVQQAFKGHPRSLKDPQMHRCRRCRCYPCCCHSCCVFICTVTAASAVAIGGIVSQQLDLTMARIITSWI